MDTYLIFIQNDSHYFKPFLSHPLLKQNVAPPQKHKNKNHILSTSCYTLSSFAQLFFQKYTVSPLASFLLSYKKKSGINMTFDSTLHYDFLYDFHII